MVNASALRPLFSRRLLIRAAVSLILLGVLFWRVDVGEVGRALRDANYIYVVPGLALFGLSKFLVAVRWRVMISKFDDIPLSPLFGTLLVSNLSNNVLPVRLGDVIRVQVPATRYGVSRARMTSTVFATESLLDGVAFAVIGLIGLALIDLNEFPTEVFWGMLGVVVGGLLAVLPLSHVRLSEGWTARGIMPLIPDRPRLWLEEIVPHFIEGLAVFRDARLGSQAFGLSFAIWLLEVGMFALFGLAFDVRLAMPAWMVVMVADNLVSSVPIAPSNIGPYEVAMSELLKALGVGVGAAGGFAIAAHSLNILWITVAGFIAMWAMKLTVDDVFSLGSGGRRLETDESAAGHEAPASSPQLGSEPRA